jgi:hypothetical protein
MSFYPRNNQQVAQRRTIRSLLFTTFCIKENVKDNDKAEHYRGEGQEDDARLRGLCVGWLAQQDVRGLPQVVHVEADDVRRLQKDDEGHSLRRVQRAPRGGE